MFAGLKFFVFNSALSSADVLTDLLTFLALLDIFLYNLLNKDHEQPHVLGIAGQQPKLGLSYFVLESIPCSYCQFPLQQSLLQNEAKQATQFIN